MAFPISNWMNYPVRKLSHKEFPALLKEISDPPESLYLRGNLPTQSKILSVVGARAYSSYGKEVCEMLIGGLRGYNVAIVSGLALGIDSIAHKSALSAGLFTLAVPGSGLSDDVLYPSTHKKLAHGILDAGGGLISEFEPDFKATPWSFPQRNRIMAGLSHATLVIEAEKKSGTLITSRLAVEYNRDVFTVPGSIFSKNSEGPHLLIRLGATPISTSKELREALGFKEDRSEEDIRENCSPEENKIFDLLRAPLTKDELIRESGLSISQANTLISLMEIKGLIEESVGEIRIRK
ncbi:MAG: DNA-processing protein DprA [Patescibacteria group bacterium]